MARFMKLERSDRGRCMALWQFPILSRQNSENPLVSPYNRNKF